MDGTIIRLCEMDDLIRGYVKGGVDESLWAMTTAHKCWKCGKQTKIVGFFYRFGDRNAELSYVSWLSKDLREAIRPCFKFFINRYVEFSDKTYFVNLCHECHMLQGDFYLYSEPGEGFFPGDEEQARQIKVAKVLDFDSSDGFPVVGRPHFGTVAEMIFCYSEHVGLDELLLDFRDGKKDIDLRRLRGLRLNKEPIF